MKTKGAKTRAAILDIAEGLVLASGFAAVPLSQVAARARITKPALLYHFPSKEALARALIERAASEDLLLLETLAEAARRRSGDPLQRMAFVLSALEDIFASLESPWGSLRAALSYQNMEFSKKTNLALANSFRRIGGFFAALFDEIFEAYGPVKKKSANVLAETLLAIIEGAALLARAQNEPKLALRPIAEFREGLLLLFKTEPAPGRSTAPEE